jgi:zinc transporter ZupT
MSFLEWPCEVVISFCTFFVATKALLAFILCTISTGMVFLVIKEIIKDLRK